MPSRRPTVETVIRCWLRGPSDICTSAYGSEYQRTSSYQKFITMKHKFDTINVVIRNDQVIDQREEMIYKWKIGDIRIDVMLRYCHNDVCEKN